MKHFYFLIFTIFTFSLSFGQVIITELADPNGNTNARYIELYNAGSTDVDFNEGNGWQIDKYLNGNSGVNRSLDLTGTIAAGDFYIIGYDNTSGSFQSTYGFAPDQLDSVNNGVTGSNGDDDLALVDGTDNIVDFFGVYDFQTDTNTDNSGTCAEYEDGRAERLTTVSSGSITFNEAEWNIWADSTVSGCTSHVNAPRTAPADFDPGQWGTPTCGLSLSSPSVVCDVITENIDTYTATVNFSGGGTGTFTVTANSGTVDLSAGDPTNDTTGTIMITGVSEGTDVIVNVTDGNICNLDYTLFSADCEPALELPLYEGFDYTVGENLDDQTNWTGFYSGDHVLIGGPDGLTYTNLGGGSQTGNHISFDGSGIDNKIEFTGVSSGEVYASFIFNITDQSSITDLTDGGYFAALAEGDSSFDTRIWVHPNTDPVGTTYEISITNASSNAVFAGTYNVGDNVFVVLSYEPGVGTVKGWVNPTSLGGTEPTPDFSETDSSPASTITRFIIRQDSSGETPSILFDELRIGTSYSDVTPTTLSNADFISDSFKLYPNPSNSGFVNITSTALGAIQANVFDMLGKQVVIDTTVVNGRLELSSLNAGIYIVKLTQNDRTTTKKLILQ
jgi:hypothetical protein